jgi:hypothetical protein
MEQFCLEEVSGIAKQRRDVLALLYCLPRAEVGGPTHDPHCHSRDYLSSHSHLSQNADIIDHCQYDSLDYINIYMPFLSITSNLLGSMALRKKS